MGDISLSARYTAFVTLAAVIATAAGVIAVNAHGTLKWFALPLAVAVAGVFFGLLFGWPSLPGIPRHGPAMVSVPDGVQSRGVAPERVAYVEVQNDGPPATFNARGEWVMRNDERVGGAAPWPVCITNQASTECFVETGGRLGLDLALLHLMGLGSWTATPLQPAWPGGQRYPDLGMDLESHHADMRLRVTIRSSMARASHGFDVGFVKQGREWFPDDRFLP